MKIPKTRRYQKQKRYKKPEGTKAKKVPKPGSY